METEINKIKTRSFSRIGIKSIVLLFGLFTLLTLLSYSSIDFLAKGNQFFLAMLFLCSMFVVTIALYAIAGIFSGTRLNDISLKIHFLFFAVSFLVTMVYLLSVVLFGKLVFRGEFFE